VLSPRRTETRALCPDAGEGGCLPCSRRERSPALTRRGNPLRRVRENHRKMGLPRTEVYIGRDRSDWDDLRTCESDVSIGPGDVLRQSSGPAPAGDGRTKPDRRFLAFAVQADELDLVLRVREMRRKIAGRTELDLTFRTSAFDFSEFAVKLIGQA